MQGYYASFLGFTANAGKGRLNFRSGSHYYLRRVERIPISPVSQKRLQFYRLKEGMKLEERR
jgi:hypothetical protein